MNDTTHLVTEPDHHPELESSMTRRRLLRTLGVIGVGGLAGGAVVSAAGAATKTTKKSTKTTSKTTKATVKAASLTTTTTKALTSAANTSTIPNETSGPFPGDGSNGANILTMPGVVRSDIRSSLGTSTTVAKGVPLTIKLNVSKNGAPATGLAVYIWHCNSDGSYSMYSPGVTNENYLRGVQPVDSSGNVTFQSIFPAAYSGRWPHIHFEVYPSVATATTSANKVATSQLALREDVCKLVYATSGYEKSISNLAQTSLSTDNVFSDGWTQELATATGNSTDGIVASLALNI